MLTIRIVIKISVLIGPNIDSVKKAANADSEGYITVIDTTGLTAQAIVKTTAIKLNKTSVKVGVGKSTTVKATLTPSNAADKNVIWSTSDSSIATVSGGKITGKKVGTATITATTNDTGLKATVKVTIIKKVTGIKLGKTSTKINVGKAETIKATISPSDATDKSVKWTSSDENVATVSTSGKITAKKAGTATITATTEDGSFTASVKVTAVVPTVKVTGVTLNKTSISMNVGGTETLKATVAPSDATNTSVTWKSSDETVATVSGGKVTGKKVGTATITVTTNDGSFTATCKVTVKSISVTGVSLDKKSVELEPGETEAVTATIIPNNAADKNVTWTSSNTKIATVSDGIIKAIKAGKVTITVKTNDGGKTASLTVKVVEPVVPEPEPEPEDDPPEPEPGPTPEPEPEPEPTPEPEPEPVVEPEEENGKDYTLLIVGASVLGVAGLGVAGAKVVGSKKKKEVVEEPTNYQDNQNNMYYQNGEQNIDYNNNQYNDQNMNYQDNQTYDQDGQFNDQNNVNYQDSTYENQNNMNYQDNQNPDNYNQDSSNN